MNVLKKALSPFWNFAPDSGQETPSADEQLATPEKMATPAQKSIKPGRQTVDEEILQQIVADVDKATPSVLSDFYGLVESLSEAIADESARFKSAFIALQKQGKASVEILLNAITAKFSAVDAASEQFDAELSESQKGIDTKRHQAAKIDDTIAELNDQIEKLKVQANDLLVGAAQEEQQLSAQKDVFTATLDSVRTAIREQETKIKTYLATQTTSTQKRKAR
jgi:chromosome segregation ATPase